MFINPQLDWKGVRGVRLSFVHTQTKESNDFSDVDDAEYIDGVEDAADLLELYFCLSVCLQVISL